MEAAKVLVRGCNPLRAFRRHGGRPSRKRLEKVLASRAAELDELRQHFDEASHAREDEILGLHQHLDASLLQLKAAKEEVAAAKNQHTGVKRQLLQASQQHAAAHHSLQQKLHQTEACKEDLLERLAMKEGSYELLSDLCTHLQSIITSKQDQVAACMSELSIFKAAADALRRQLEEVQHSKERLEQMMESKPNQQCKQRGTAFAPAASQLSRTAAAGSGCPIVTAAPTSPRLPRTLNGQMLTTERFVDLLFECGLGDAAAVLLSDTSSIVEVMAALRPEQVAKLEVPDADVEDIRKFLNHWLQTQSSSSSSSSSSFSLTGLPPANGMVMPSWYTVDTVKAKEAVVRGHPLSQFHSKSHMGPDDFIRILSEECQQLGGTALSFLEGSWGTLVVNTQGALECLHDIYSLRLQQLALPCITTSDVTRLLREGINRAQEYRQVTAGPMGLVRGPADVLVHVEREVCQVEHQDLREVVHKLPELLDLHELFEEGNSSRGRGSGSGGGGGGVADDIYQLKAVCASTWPGCQHVVAFVKDATGMWLLLDDASTPRRLGPSWADVAAFMTLTSRPTLGYEPTLLVYGRPA
eukprot:gene6544-6770_t